jgi:hypothetical protein
MSLTSEILCEKGDSYFAFAGRRYCWGENWLRCAKTDIAGTRVPVKTLFDYLERGHPLAVFLMGLCFA